MQDTSILEGLLAGGLAHCAVAIDQHGNLMAGLFLAGLIGSASHCVGMCGPFVLSQTMARLEQIPADQMQEFHRLTGAALLPYHFGRGTTYAVLGASAARLTGGIVDISGVRWIPALLLGIAAVLFLVYAANALGAGITTAMRRPATFGGNLEAWWSRAIGRRVGPLFARPIGWRGYVLGMILGFLPCGLLYGAIAAAAASGKALTGFLAMAAFTAGTVPALVTVGIAGHIAGSRWRSIALRMAPWLMLVNAAALLYLAWRWIVDG